ncbi:MAG TPA: RCC1 domain-containing protein, partial [Polyangiaceae bacterium]|nr:RCC1 domain-containing protein [Polyangiaceae bacterium]
MVATVYGTRLYPVVGAPLAALLICCTQKHSLPGDPHDLDPGAASQLDGTPGLSGDAAEAAAADALEVPVPDGSTPVAVPADLGFSAQLAVGLWHACSLGTSGDVRCWGYDELGET